MSSPTVPRSDPDHRTSSLLLLFLITLGLLIRLSYIEQTEVDHPIRADALHYVTYGYNLYRHHTFSLATGEQPIRPDSFRSPGLPLLIAAAIAAGGERYWYDTLLQWQAILGTLVVALTYLTGRRFLSRTAALGAATLTAISPHLVAMGGYILTETLFSFLLLLSLWLFLLLAGRSGTQMAEAPSTLLLAIACAIAFGCAWLTNETALFIPYLLILFLRRRERQSTTTTPLPRRTIAVMLVLFTLFPLTWNLRNLLEQIPPQLRGQARALATMAHGSYPDYLYKNPELRYYPYRDDPHFQEYSASFSNFIRILAHRASEEPLRYLRWYLFDKPRTLWTWNILQGQGDVYVYPVTRSLYQNDPLWDVTRRAMKLLHPVILLLALAALPLWLRRRKQEADATPATAPVGAGVMMLLLIYYTLLYNCFATWPRYAVPLRPELYLWSMWGLEALVTIILRRHSCPTSPADGQHRNPPHPAALHDGHTDTIVMDKAIDAHPVNRAG
ncbi:MAG: phospholipid carrier-dependent glycosyltransferase [Zetaproteobacteria bacterium]|nr:MAG: phospholipid carrier-dependent glycosyltransferase [Zetaproteobacteria bacterium]